MWADLELLEATGWSAPLGGPPPLVLREGGRLEEGEAVAGEAM